MKLLARVKKEFETIAGEFGANERAFTTSLVGAAIGVMILCIVILDVAVPIVQDAINCASLTGASATIAGLIPMFMILGLFVAVAIVFVIRWL